jgi:hypothetical protein
MGVFAIESLRPRNKYVIGPDGSPSTIADLPTPLEEACSRYTLTVDELLSWQHSIDQHGLAGLRSTRTQQY